MRVHAVKEPLVSILPCQIIAWQTSEYFKNSAPNMFLAEKEEIRGNNTLKTGKSYPT